MDRHWPRPTASSLVMALGRRRWLLAVFAVIVTVMLLRTWSSASSGGYHAHFGAPKPNPKFLWRKIKFNHPLSSPRPLPSRPSRDLPKVQADFGPETAAEKATRKERQKIIKDSFIRSWESYQRYAWLRDELKPVSGKDKDAFGGWGATLIDSLDTLWIMDMEDDFKMAVDTVDRYISFEKTDAEEINVFETTIRFLGGLVAAYDMSGDPRLLSKARDAGDMILKAFDTPNNLPVARWNIKAAARGQNQKASDFTLLAEIGSLCMEFTRLSLISGDPKYYNAVQRISELLADSQMSTKLPGLWPIIIDAEKGNFDAGTDYSLGAMADSAFEYLPKMAAMLGETDNIYGDMYIKSMDAAQKYLFFRPMTPNGENILFPGNSHTREEGGAIVNTIEPLASHLVCFAGGMYALGGRLMSNLTHVELGDQLTRACVWAYDAMSTDVMPEVFHLQPCPDLSPCAWDEQAWRRGVMEAHESTDADLTIQEQNLPKGFTRIGDSKYHLRPEAIESVFIMYRITADPYWRERAWEMWQAIDNLTRTDLANSAVMNVNPREGGDPEKFDSMESFWMGETLKYFYLIFSEPGLVSLDDWVLNTEAHPFRRLTR